MGIHCTDRLLSASKRTAAVCLAVLIALWSLDAGAAAAKELKLSQAETDATDQAREDADDAPLPPIHYSEDVLPEAVLKTRNKLLLAARSGDLENLRPILEANKVKPIFSFGDDDDAIAYWKASSFDGTGRDILAEMIKVFSSGFVQVSPGTQDALWIWPYHFVYPLDKLGAEQEVELYLLIPPEHREEMEHAGGYIGFRAGIDPDGTLIFFVAGD